MKSFTTNKKILTVAIAIIWGFVLSPLESRSQAFDKGTKVLSAGIGIGSSLGSFSYSSQLPALSVQYEQGVWEVGGPGVISLGGYLGYKSYNWRHESTGFTSSASWKYTIVGLRSAYHYQGLENDNIDVYGGLMLSANILNYTYKDSTGGNMNSGNFGNTTGFTLYVGGRYYFAPNLGVFSELGYGVSYLNLGLVLKL
ncbi:hypothetical protein [Negadavirga shengliensis]|uniref:Outer membrane protein beta-barrel domain-containing protein n=1 Tax=Negadavirga shengliensis TaxID=1389218 RepID=A0ABV9T3A3_9BACT